LIVAKSIVKLSINSCSFPLFGHSTRDKLFEVELRTIFFANGAERIL